MKRRLGEGDDAGAESAVMSDEMKQMVAALLSKELMSGLLTGGAQRGVRFGSVAFEGDEQSSVSTFLGQKLGKDYLTRRPGPGGKRLTYIESCKAIELANRAFGFNGWSCRIVECKEEFREKRGDRWTISFSSLVRIELKDGTSHEDVGFGSADGQRDLGAALEQAKKASISDGRKRALRLFGEYLGNSCYDREHIREVTSARAAPNIPMPPTNAGVAVASPLQLIQQHPVNPQQEHQHQQQQSPAVRNGVVSRPGPGQHVPGGIVSAAPAVSTAAPPSNPAAVASRISAMHAAEEHKRQQYQQQQHPHQQQQQQYPQQQQQHPQQQQHRQAPATSGAINSGPTGNGYPMAHAGTVEAARTSREFSSTSNTSSSTNAPPPTRQPLRVYATNAPPPTRMGGGATASPFKLETAGHPMPPPGAAYNVEDLSFSQFDYDPGTTDAPGSKRMRT